MNERFGNPQLAGSSATLVEAIRNDRMVRDAHGLSIMVQALAHVVAHQGQRLEELENAAKGRARK